MTGKPNKFPPHIVTDQNRGVKDLSRRCFLNNAGCAAMGGLVAVAGSSLFTEKAMATAVPEAPALPWKYTKLDPLEAGKRGYKNYLLNGG